MSLFEPSDPPPEDLIQGSEPACVPAVGATWLPPEINLALLEGLAASGAGVALFDERDNYLFGSPAFEAFLDVQPGPQTYASMMRHCHRSNSGIAIPNPDIEAWIRAALLKRRSAPVRNFEKDLCDGRWLRISETTFNDGWVLNVLSDITDLKSNEATLRKAHDDAVTAATVDGLTGLFNRPAIMARFATALSEAEDAGVPLAISLVDLDHFKQINDRFGHDVGDCVLTGFADVWRQFRADRDVLGRVGGEEFLLIMPGRPQADAVRTVERFRSEIARSVPLPGRALRYSMSAGVAVREGHETCKELYARADQLLYRAKAGGRNVVAFQ